MYVLPYEVSRSGPAPVSPVPARSVAGLNTHDTPTFAAWLEGADIEDAARLGFLDDEAARRARASRIAECGALSRYLQRRGLVPDAPSPRNLLRGALRHLAASGARITLVNLEDLWLETHRQNIPGTTDDRHPNWRHKAALTLEEIDGEGETAGALREVNAVRTVEGPL